MSYSALNGNDSVIAEVAQPVVEILSPNEIALGDDLEKAMVEKTDGTRARAPTFTALSPDNAPTVLTFSNLTVTSRTHKNKKLLDNLSGSITGGFWAIMGASGGGKTTLLSTLSLRLDSRFMDIEGEFRLNGREYSRMVLKAMSAYVMQDDLMHAELTVYETLTYAAQLRMGDAHTPEQRQERVEEVMTLMGIDHCRDVIIGNSRRKGVSGGERKRVSVAIELLNRPKLIFLDEPTSGLDSTTALSVCEALKALSDSGECTVVCTIHQPQPKIFDLFDNLILMRKGSIVYLGAAYKVERFLGEVCHSPTPSDMNIADHILEVIAPHRRTAEEGDERENEGDGEEKDSLVKQSPPIDLTLGHDKAFYSGDAMRAWIDQFSILFRRNYRQYLRNYDIIIMNFCMTVVLAAFVGSGLWYQIGNAQDSVAKRVPSLFFACIAQGIVGSLQSINSFPSERAIMLRERQAGAYCVSAYFLAKSAMDTLSQLWPPMVYTCLIYPLIGYQPGAKRFFRFMAFMCLDSMAATSLATAVTCFCVSIEMSTVVVASLFEISRLYSGFFASPMQLKEIPDWKFADALSYIKYSFIGVTLNELEGLDLECVKGLGACKYKTGEQIIVEKGYDEYTIGSCAGYLIVLIVGFRILAYFGLRFIKS